MKNSKDTIRNRTRDFQACSAVPQPTAPPRAPIICSVKLQQYIVIHNSQILQYMCVVFEQLHSTQFLALHVCTTLSDPNTRLCVSGYYFSSGNNHHTVYLTLHEWIVISAQKPVIIIDFFRRISPYIEVISSLLTYISPRLFPST
jgi:hypothetical protein